MIVFGVDPGSLRTGWGVIEVDGNRMRRRDHGVIRTDGDAPLSVRCEMIFRVLRDVIAGHEPAFVSMESIFHAKNARSALVLGHARGVALLAARMNGRDVIEISPAEVKKAVTGHGQADKKQVQAMVRVLLGTREEIPVDASDALAIAISSVSHRRGVIPERKA